VKRSRRRTGEEPLPRRSLFVQVSLTKIVQRLFEYGEDEAPLRVSAIGARFDQRPGDRRRKRDAA
jgi:hypothetical protein